MALGSTVLEARIIVQIEGANQLLSEGPEDQDDRHHRQTRHTGRMP
jgi:hypothetical protein